ncbi:MAG: hypothetical protein O6934_04590 [SAR324 cluster bacterium]|nr:hypothetical protein [SAR324 cluster bacterium]
MTRWPMGNDPFQLFCLYYLGLTPEGEYRFTNGNKTAAYLNWTVAELMKNLRGHGLHPDTVLNTDFPLARHQVDLQIAAEKEHGDQLKAMAEQIYKSFRNTSKRRDWLAEISQEKQEDNKRGSS